MENSLQTRDATAAEGYTTYYTEAIGRNASDSGGAQFFMPDYENDDSGEESSDEDLARQYDLGNHLDSDRTTLAEKTSESADSLTTPATGADFSMSEANDTESYDQPVFINDARALVSTRQPRVQIRNVEKIAARTTAQNNGAFLSTQSQALSGVYDVDHENVESGDDIKGTRNANVSDEMVYMRDNVITDISNYAGNSTGTTDENGSRSQENRKNIRLAQGYVSSTEVNAGAAAVAAFETFGGNRATTGRNVPQPRIKEISQAILDEIERMRTNPDSNSVDITLDLADGDSLDMRLRWRGSDVRISFGSGSEEMRGEIENGWASLVLSAGNSGVMLDKPHFDADETTSTETSHYA
jgi:hypothetical protein